MSEFSVKSQLDELLDQVLTMVDSCTAKQRRYDMNLLIILITIPISLIFLFSYLSDLEFTKKPIIVVSVLCILLSLFVVQQTLKLFKIRMAQKKDYRNIVASLNVIHPLLANFINLPNEDSTKKLDLALKWHYININMKIFNRQLSKRK